MSLINEALKKAQRQRTEEQADLNSLMPGGGGGSRSSKGAPALSTQSMVLLGAGVVALFVVCVVGTVVWINQPAPKKTVPTKPATASAPADAGGAIAIVVPLAGRATPADAAATATTPKLATTPATASPETAPPTMSSARSAPIADLATSARTESSPVAMPAGKFDERVQALVDGFRVAGIRASGTGSKVLLNEKVFKLNDIVDRTNGLRLTEVSNDRLTFTTADGVTYVKNF